MKQGQCRACKEEIRVFTAFDWLQARVLKVHACAGCGGVWCSCHRRPEVDLRLHHIGNVSWPPASNRLTALSLSPTLWPAAI